MPKDDPRPKFVLDVASDDEEQVSTRPTASADELAIFISSDNVYRILVPKEWDPESIPQFAYLVMSAVLRLARQREEMEWCRELYEWALENFNEPRIKKVPRDRAN